MSDEEFWGDVEIEPEVATWLASLDDGRFGQVRFAIDRLAEEGPLLGEPHTRQLREKVRELRFGLTASVGGSHISSPRAEGLFC